jgi:hypothetical protein
MPMLEGRVDAVIGVDTHRDRHAAASPRARASARSAAASSAPWPASCTGCWSAPPPT